MFANDKIILERELPNLLDDILPAKIDAVLNAKIQRGVIGPFDTTQAGWTKKIITFPTPFQNKPNISLTVGEGSGDESVEKHTLKYVGYERLTNKTCKIAIYDTDKTADIVISWIAISND